VAGWLLVVHISTTCRRHCNFDSTFHIALLFAARNGILLRYRPCNCVRTCENPHPDCGGCTPGCGCPSNVPISYNGKCITLKSCEGLSHIMYAMGLRMSPATRLRSRN